MGAPAVLPATVAWPQGVTHLTSTGVASLLGVGSRRVRYWQTGGLITASTVTLGGHRRFTLPDVQAFLQQACLAQRLGPGDIVSCLAWNSGRPVRVLYVTPDTRGHVLVRWQDIAARAHAMDVMVGHSKLVRRLHREAP
ncbi:MerR family transcriptional regulator [Streptosporangium sp. G12]